MAITIMNKPQFTRPEGTGGKSVLGSDNVTPLNELEKNALGNLDEDKLTELAKCLFTLNNRRYGPIPGAYMVMCTKPGKEWCVAQLNADRAKPFILFEDKVFSSIEKDKYPLVLKEIDEILKSIMSGLNIELNYWQDLPRASYLSGLQVSMGSFFEKLNKIGMNQKDQITLVQQLFSHFKVDWDEGARGNIKTSLQMPSLEILTSRKSFFDNPMGLDQNSTLSENNINELASTFYEYRVHLRRF